MVNDARESRTLTVAVARGASLRRRQSDGDGEQKREDDGEGGEHGRQSMDEAAVGAGVRGADEE